MGLDTTHNCWHGAYSGFREFRELVGKAAGLPYVPSKDGRGDRLDIDWDRVTERQIYGHWDRKSPTAYRIGYDPPITDAVLYLLIHSDCGGKLRRGYLPALKARLEELEPSYERLIARHPNVHYLSSRLRQFTDGLGEAIEAG